MVMEIIGLTVVAIAAGLATAWYLSQIRNTMIRLTSETTKYRELANAAEAQMSAEREVRELRQLNDELESKAYDYQLGEASAMEDNTKLRRDLNTTNVRKNELAVQLKNTSDALYEVKEDYERVCRQFAEHKEEANQDFNGQKHRENQLIKDNEGLKTRLKAELDGRTACERKNESLRFALQDERVKVQQLTNKLTETKEELRSKRLQLNRAHKVNEKLNADLDDWESMDDNTDLTPNNPNHSKHPHWHKSKAQGITRVHWHTIASACRTHFEAMYLKAANNKNVSKNEIKRRYYLAQEGINTIEAGRKK